MKTCLKIERIILVLSFILLIPGCSPSSNTSPEKIKVAVSIIPQEAFVKEVAGNLVDVITIIPPGKSPANYAAAPQEIIKLSTASIYFTIGVPAENGSILPEIKDITKNIQVVSMADEVKKAYAEREFSPGMRDPHIWLSPKRVEMMVEVIARELSKIDSRNSEIYRKNASDFIEQLKNLDTEVTNLLKNGSSKAFIMYHPSLGYFADDYGLTMLSIQNEGKEASPQDLQNIIDFAVNKGIKTVFYQAEIDSRQSRTLASEIGGKDKSVISFIL